MKVQFNKDLLLWAVGVLQPANAQTLSQFISEMFQQVDCLPTIGRIGEQLEEWRAQGLVARVHGRSRYYSLTYDGQAELSVPLKRYRDEVRLFLLKRARSARFVVSEEPNRELAGDSPASDGSTDIKEGKRPISSTAVPRGPRNTGRTYWPLVSKQLEINAGSESSSSDIFLDYFSFPSVKSIHNITKDPAHESDMSATDLALAIGISPRLLTSLIHAPQNHYRSFKIGKRGGGSRTINSPRVFLKTIQYWIVDYLLYMLNSHPTCHSYQINKSIQSNANPHVGKKYVANVDVESFFDSITSSMVFKLLKEHCLGDRLAKNIARLVTLNNALPQGSPASPIISNAYLYRLDDFISKRSRVLGVTYTRYADDMTLSGNSRDKIKQLISLIKVELNKDGLRLNEKKTRIASRSGQQKVTGIVVNERLSPPRIFRRKVRAMFHQASLNPQEADLARLYGYNCYLSSFEALRDTKELSSYRAIINELKERCQ